MLELVNRARMDPEAEAARFGIDINQGLPSGTIDASPKQPLAMDSLLIDSARSHSLWMLENDVFSHTGVDGTSSHERMVFAGFEFTGSWRSGENLSWNGTTGRLDADGIIAEQHQSLFLSPGHRENILQGDFREVGIGIETGVFTSRGSDFNASMATQNFARTGTEALLTGVIYDDQDGDNFYSIGEGVGGVTISAAGPAGTFFAESYDAGGYSMTLPPGTYTVRLAGPGIDAIVSTQIVIDDENVRVAYDTLDERLEADNSASPPAAVEITGSEDDDIIESNVPDALIYGLAGDDIIRGGAGNDQIFAGPGDDLIHMDFGNDAIDGGAGLDTAVFDDDAALVSISYQSEIVTVNGPDGIDTLTGVERLQFTDRTLAFDDNAATVARLYQAAFGREADEGGLGFWLGRIESGARDLESIGGQFVASQEFEDRVGTGLTTEEFVASLYPNVFGRGADAEGLAFWTGRIDNGPLNRIDVLLRFADSDENIARTAGFIDDGVWFS